MSKLPLTKQGVPNLDLMGPPRARNKRATPPCSRGLAPHSFLMDVCKECGASMEPKRESQSLAYESSVPEVFSEYFPSR